MNKTAALLVLMFLFAAFGTRAHTQPRRKNRKPVILGERFKIDVSQDGRERQFPSVYKFGKNIFVSYSEHRDAVLPSPVDAMMISRDNGRTWKEKITHPDFYFSSMIEKNGILYGIVYFTYPDSPGRERMVYWTSSDMGRSWKKQEGIVLPPVNKQFRPGHGTWGSMLFHRGMQVMNDGSVQGVMYGVFDHDHKFVTAWVRSDDNCATWKITGEIASGVTDTFKNVEGYCEPSFARVRDGSILCVMRIGSFLPLFQTRSLDGGHTWSKPVTLPGLSAKSSESVDPHLLLMHHGLLALSFGRPGDRIAFSRDGSGYRWDTSLVTYDGETTGYTGIVEKSPGKLLLIADQGRTGAKEMAIWGRVIKVRVK